MTVRRGIERNFRSPDARAGRRVVGAASTVEAFLAFGLSPLATAPSADAEVFDIDWMLDLLGPGLGDAVLNLGDASAWETLGDPGGCDVFLANLVDPVTWALPGAATVTLAAEPAAATDFFNDWIYQPMWTLQQAWINDPFGAFINTNLINPIGQALFGQDLIGNGADGIDGGTLAQAAGGDGGLWFGDGGTGGTDANGVGGAGGDAVGWLFGNGGGPAAQAGHGGAGGDGTTSQAGGAGGTGGTARISAQATDSTATGGAGGNGSDGGGTGGKGGDGTVHASGGSTVSGSAGGSGGAGGPGGFITVGSDISNSVGVGGAGGSGGGGGDGTAGGPDGTPGTAGTPGAASP